MNAEWRVRVLYRLMHITLCTPESKMRSRKKLNANNFKNIGLDGMHEKCNNWVAKMI